MDAAAYEARQRRFHEALAAEPPPGFHGSLIVAARSLPWAAAGGAVYEDWYLVADFTALGSLNEAAVSRSRSAPHDAAAAVAAGGAGGIYALVAGTPVPHPEVARWFARPPGERHADLMADVAPLLSSGGGGLWMRQMVLGPAPEFCLHGAAPLPDRLGAVTVDLRPVHATLGEAHG